GPERSAGPGPRWRSVQQPRWVSFADSLNPPYGERAWSILEPHIRGAAGVGDLDEADADLAVGAVAVDELGLLEVLAELFPELVDLDVGVVGGGHDVVEADEPAGADQRAVGQEVLLDTGVEVVAVDEEEVDDAPAKGIFGLGE